MMELDEGGYVFQLERPVHVHVLEGRIRGDRKKPIRHPIPKYDEEAEAYLTPDGGAVEVKPNGELIPYELPEPDAGMEATDGGLFDAHELLIPWEGGQAEPATSEASPSDEDPAADGGAQKGQAAPAALTNTAPPSQ